MLTTVIISIIGGVAGYYIASYIDWHWNLLD